MQVTVSETWPTATIGEVATVAISGVDKHIVAGEVSVRLCNYLHVYRNGRLAREIDYAAGSATPREVARFQLQRGDVLITKDSETADDIGIPAVVVHDLPNTICGYHLAIVRPRTTIDPVFLGYVFESDVAKRHFLRTANGVTRFGIGMGAISSLVVPLPPPTEQVSIGRVLEAVDATIERMLGKHEGCSFASGSVPDQALRDTGGSTGQYQRNESRSRTHSASRWPRRAR